MVEIKVFDDKFQKAVNRVISKVDDLTIPFTLMIQSWYKSNQAIFALKGPGKYEDLSPKYKVVKNKQWGFVYPILKARGDLAESILQPGGNSVAKILNKNTLVLGSSHPLAAYHQLGTKNMPKRPFVLLGAEQTAPNALNQRRNAWIAILTKYVKDVSKELGGES